MSLHDLSQVMIDRLQGSASAKIIYGDPVTAHGRTIIPVGKVAWGFGGGLGPGRIRPENLDKGSVGEGGGGGVGATPVGIIEISDAGTRFISIEQSWKPWAGLAAGILVGLIVGRKL